MSIDTRNKKIVLWQTWNITSQDVQIRLGKVIKTDDNGLSNMETWNIILGNINIQKVRDKSYAGPYSPRQILYIWQSFFKLPQHPTSVSKKSSHVFVMNGHWDIEHLCWLTLLHVIRKKSVNEWGRNKFNVGLNVNEWNFRCVIQRRL